MSQAREIQAKIEELVREYYNVQHKKEKKFTEGDRISYSGRVFDEEELVNLVNASLEFWLTSGHYAQEFETNLAKFLGVSYCSLTNSGSSANLLAFMALTAPELGERRIQKGDEVIAVAAAFPTTVTPIIQYGAVPVFLDVTIPEYNIDCRLLEQALSPKTKAVFLAHTLGNPFDLQTIRSFCNKHGLWLIEDNCDALGSEYFINGEWKKTGSVGDISTCSFYPPHHITMGEGGAVCTSNPLLHRMVNSFRDWGRDCFCPSGTDDSCHHRYTQQFGELPYGYDHKYVYSHFGYNLKATDLQASIGCVQLKKLPQFTEARRKNWEYIRQQLDSLSDMLILPECDRNANPSWFGFLITLRENAPVSRDALTKHLEEKNIQTRNLFSGNIILHPCFDEMRKSQKGYRVIRDLTNTNTIMSRSFWIGVYPGMTKEMLDYMCQEIKEGLNGNLFK